MRRFRFILPCLQIILTLVSVLIDKSINNGLGEGGNQILAHLVSNVEFIFKSIMRIEDIVNYNFRIITVIMAVVFWFFMGLLIDLLVKKLKKSKST